MRYSWQRSFSAYWIGLALLCAGLAFAVWARVELGRNWSGSVTVKEGHELIRSGPYAYVRHPIYTGLIAALIGTAVIIGTLRALTVDAQSTGVVEGGSSITQQLAKNLFLSNERTVERKLRTIRRLWEGEGA